MATTKYEVASIASLLTTELNALTSTSLSALGTEYDNATGLYVEGLFELLVTFGTGPTAGETVDLYLVPASDGTNYADGSSSVVSDNHFIGSFVVRSVTSAQRIVLREIVKLPPLKFKVHVKNNTSQSMASSGNTVKMVPIRYQSA